MIPKVFPKIQSLNWDELDGKLLEIKVSHYNDTDYGAGVRTVVGHDKENGKIYVLHNEHYYH